MDQSGIHRASKLTKFRISRPKQLVVRRHDTAGILCRGMQVPGHHFEVGMSVGYNVDPDLPAVSPGVGGTVNGYGLGPVTV